MPIGPTLPPHLAKRTRADHDEDRAEDRASSPDSSVKRRRVAGPAPPPASHADDASDSSDDDFGPAPPPADGSAASCEHGHDAATSAFDTAPQFAHAPATARRDDWMTMPPTHDDLAARMDPTKARPRKFNTGKSAARGAGMSSAWTETPQQKLKRLQDEAMGIAAPSNAPATPHDSPKTKDDERRARKMREKMDAARGKSLVEQHAEKGTAKHKEDDPSKRAFDYEKDMAVVGTANNKQRRELLAKSKGFSDRFARGTFL
ncbi:hypothetical protein ACEQ8H_008419 [Pleosporales sp. CAS-2024a]